MIHCSISESTCKHSIFTPIKLSFVLCWGIDKNRVNCPPSAQSVLNKNAYRFPMKKSVTKSAESKLITFFPSNLIVSWAHAKSTRKNNKIWDKVEKLRSNWFREKKMAKCGNVKGFLIFFIILFSIPRKLQGKWTARCKKQ